LQDPLISMAIPSWAVHPFAAADSRVRGSFGFWSKVDGQSPQDLGRPLENGEDLGAPHAQ
jgi:hypothetical protein